MLPMYRNVNRGATGETLSWKSKVYGRLGATRGGLSVAGIEFPASRIVGEILFCPGQNSTRADGIKHDFRSDQSGILYLAREAASNFVADGVSDRSTSTAVPSLMTTS